MFPVPTDLAGSLLLLLGIPILLAFSFFLFPKVVRSISHLSSNKRDDTNRRRELLRLLVLSEIMDSFPLDSDSDTSSVYGDGGQKENGGSVAIDDDQEKR